jgi:hypothetical protein
MTRSGALRRNWYRASVRSNWSQTCDWWSSAVDAVTDALTDGKPDARAACEALGRQRAEAGVFLDEARADIRMAAQVAGLNQAATAELVDGLTIGWVEHAMDGFFAAPCLDPLTELASLPYLITRLDEIRADARVRGELIELTHTLTVVKTAPTSDAVERETHMITVQVALRTAFPGGVTLARIGPNCAVALVSHTDSLALAESLAVLQAELDAAVKEGRLPRTRTWLEPLPHDRAGIPPLLRELNA